MARARLLIVCSGNSARSQIAEGLFRHEDGDRFEVFSAGAKIVGHWQSEVAKRIDVFALVLHHGVTVEALNDLDLSYTPPLGSPWDAVQMAAQEWVRASGSAARIRGG